MSADKRKCNKCIDDDAKGAAAEAQTALGKQNKRSK